VDILGNQSHGQKIAAKSGQLRKNRFPARKSGLFMAITGTKQA
jgi:hypothetical protein